MVYGTNIVYESQHAQWVKGCLEKLLKKRSGDIDPMCIMHLIIELILNNHRNLALILLARTTEP